MFCFSLRNLWRFQAGDSGNRAIHNSRVCAAKFVSLVQENKNIQRMRGGGGKTSREDHPTPFKDFRPPYLCTFGTPPGPQAISLVHSLRGSDTRPHQK